MLPIKRKRSSNITQDEKLKFVRLLQEEGEAIITKVTSHDASSNKAKEIAWQRIAEILSASNNTVRTPDTLKKLWQKLKSDAKTYRAGTRYANGTGRGPAKPHNDPVIELVVAITGRGSTGIINVQDCDASCDTSTAEVATEMTYSDLYKIDPQVQIPDNEIYVINEEAETLKLPSDDNAVAPDLPYLPPQKDADQSWMKRRQPTLTTSDERTSVIKTRAKIGNKLASERLKAERAKYEIISLQKQQMTELHNMKMENEKLKKQLLESVISKYKNGEIGDIEAASSI